eukprot:CAMPEP_0197199406 /NCGR_PEP_ID=MMETSP1423-20130617/33868_1 /TAXON_ID=476441 /ORGANISM="Pseudo-nitzschia heimii, Strain UNC1101" /LENGTH=743 /DNA_ID=CAMNT_0042653263 /DNA_START=97 /DNA_END=2325 /DNA_ORIENTATION=+
MTSTEPSHTFSPVYFSPEGRDGSEKDKNDFRAGSFFVDASSVPHVDTIDHSTPHSAISPTARRILLGQDSDDDFEYETGIASRSNTSISVIEGEESPSSNDNSQAEIQHSLPNVEDYKLSVAAASAGESTWSFLSSTRLKILYPALFFILVLLIVILFAIAAIVGMDNRKSANQVENSEDIGTHHARHYDDRLTHLQNYMVKYGISSTDHFFNEGSIDLNSPQSQAIRWLANEDRQFPTLPTHEQDLTTEEGYSLVTRYAMAVFYFATDGKNWDNSFNFLDPDRATCDWSQIFAPPKGELGVLCNQTTRRIIGLSLISNNITGGIPSELSKLTSLQYFESIENSLTGTVPSELQMLTDMRTFVVAFNQLSGKLPSWMPQTWPNLEFLYLSNNALSGTIPSEFFQFQKLSVLALDDNILTGNTDVIWNSMKSLEYVYLEDNDFTGTLPNLFTEHNAGLITLDISSNRMRGTLPADLFQLNHLEVLDLHDNRFDSGIPSTIPENNDRLKFVALHENKLSGAIPSTIANLRQLSHLDLTHNRLTGTIPIELERLHDTLTYLFLGENNYQKGPIPSFVYALKNLRELSLKGSKLSGTISRVIGALEAMVLLDLDDNQLEGSIPDEIGMLTNLQFLLLNRNELSSAVPVDSLSKLQHLRFLLLDNNHLFGELNPICGLEFLNVVYVDCGEIACLEGCCNCCRDGQPCHDNNLISNHDPVWEADYTRQFFDFTKGDDRKFYSNRDDDYW